jgi:hypothetical protein
MNYTVINQNNKVGVQDAAGNIVIPCIYKGAREVTCTRWQRNSQGELEHYRVGEVRFVVQKGRFWALTNEQHDLLTPFKYTGLSNIQTDLIRAEIDKKCGLLDIHGNEMTTMDYDEFWNIGQPIFFASRNKLHGYLDHSGNVVIPLIHEKMGILVMDGLVPVVQNKQTGFMDTQGNLVIPYMYHGMAHFENGLSCICKMDGSKKEFGLINKNNDIILPFFKYEFFDVVRKVWEKNKKIVFDDFKPFLENQDFLQVQAFLTTIHHFQTEKYTTYFDLTKDDIEKIYLLIDPNHKVGKKLLPLLVEIEKMI